MRRNRRCTAAAGALQTLDPSEQRAHRAINLGPGCLHERELQTRARIGPRARTLHRLTEQLKQAHDRGVLDALGLGREGRVGLGRQRELLGHLTERLHDQELARANLEVSCE